MEIEFVAAGAALGEKTALALVVFEGDLLSGAAGQLDGQTGGALGRAIAAARFNGGKGQVLDVLGAARRVVVNKDSTVIVEGGGTHDAIANRVKQLKSEIEASESELTSQS